MADQSFRIKWQIETVINWKNNFIDGKSEYANELVNWTRKLKNQPWE